MSFKHLLASAALIAAGFTASTPANAGNNEYLGELMLTGYSFCPRGSFNAEGQLLAIAQYQALFSLYGTTFGGDGRTTFGLPDLRGRTAIGQGNGPGLTPRQVGEKVGTETVTLITAQIPAHSHTGTLKSTGVLADSGNPNSKSFGLTPNKIYHDSAPSGSTMEAGMVVTDNTGGNQAHPNMQPSLGMRYCVVSEGTFPSRN